MLSAESADGQYPVEAIRTMDRIAVEVESDPSYGAIVHATRTPPLATAADAIAAAAHTVADTVKLAGIICYTATGSTALRVARERPGLPVIGLSPVVATGRRLAMAWGVHCVLTSDPENQAAMVRKACRIAFDEGFAGAKDDAFGHGRAASFQRLLLIVATKPRFPQGPGMGGVARTKPVVRVRAKVCAPAYPGVMKADRQSGIQSLGIGRPWPVDSAAPLIC
jgi:hypothetical protein